jgi:hypothetical protein
MTDSEPKLVFHGSKALFEEAKPKKNIKTRTKEGGERHVVFEGISFHATPFKWIALAYTYNRQTVEVEGKKYIYTMGVDLYGESKELDIIGIGSLEESLEKLYSGGGYIYHFNHGDFVFVEGLGNREVIIDKDITPIKIERIENPIEEMKKEGITFKFVDLTLPKNEEFRKMLVG